MLHVMRIEQKVPHIKFPRMIYLFTSIRNQVSSNKYKLLSISNQVQVGGQKYPCLMSLRVKFGQDSTSYYWDLLIPTFFNY